MDANRYAVKATAAGRMTVRDFRITVAQARAAWLHAQGLDSPAPFGRGPAATAQAVAHLGYVQIDTINVIERCHHHILYNRISDYARADLEQAQSTDKTVFEYWTHALAYVPAADYRFFQPAMAACRAAPERFEVTDSDYAALLRRIRTGGPLSIRDIDDDVLVEKTHLWGSRKPSRAALRRGFFQGDLVVARRTGMLKTYALAARHFGWPPRPRPATARQVAAYLLQRALRAQGVVSLDSICYGTLAAKPAVAALIAAAVRRRALLPVQLGEASRVQHWATPATLDGPGEAPGGPASPVHILSPFDPLIIQRKRLSLLFGYDHRFEAYVPPAKRVFGYFTLPVLIGDVVAAAIDLKLDRPGRRLKLQKWTWVAPERAGWQAAIDGALTAFERFQLAPSPVGDAGRDAETAEPC